MTDAVEADPPVCNASDGGRERFAVARVAEHVGDDARRDDDHRVWIDEHTRNGTLSEIREALTDYDRARN